MVKISREGMETMMECLFGIEGLVYETLLPAQKELAGLREPLPWPKCYFSDVKGRQPYCLVLEDFGPEGFVNADRSKGLDAAHMRLALEQLGKFHGASMALVRLRPELFKTIKDQLPVLFRLPEFCNIMKPFIVPVPSLPGLVESRYPKGSHVHTVLRKLCDSFKDTFPQLMWPLPPEDGRGCTFVHGDCMINNMAFKYDKDGAVQACKLYDFQVGSYMEVAQDFMWLLFCNTEKEMRDEHWESLLRGYIDVVHDTLRASGCDDPEDIYSLDLLKEQLKRLAVPALCIQPLMWSFMTADDDQVDEVRNDMAAPEQSVSVPLRTTPKLIEHYIGLIENVIDWGWFPTVEDIDRYTAEA
ncbi:uncharacterized protein LOC113204128 isoform X2 [Frankliniella occidentalis]|nr:uncharacterized protein LOC113204128 isoform X2 [Frankliniella occidentalis]